MRSGNCAAGKSGGQPNGIPANQSTSAAPSGSRLVRCAPAARSPAKRFRMKRMERAELFCTQAFQSRVASVTATGAATSANIGTWRTETSAACAHSSTSAGSEKLPPAQQQGRGGDARKQQQLEVKRALGTEARGLELVHGVANPVRAQVLEDMRVQREPIRIRERGGTAARRKRRIAPGPPEVAFQKRCERQRRHRHHQRKEAPVQVRPQGRERNQQPDCRPFPLAVAIEDPQRQREQQQRENVRPRQVMDAGGGCHRQAPRHCEEQVRPRQSM